MPQSRVVDPDRVSAILPGDTRNREDIAMHLAQVPDLDCPQHHTTNSKDSIDSIDSTSPMPQAQHYENSGVAWLADLPAETWTLVAEQV